VSGERRGDPYLLWLYRGEQHSGDHHPAARVWELIGERTPFYRADNKLALGRVLLYKSATMHHLAERFTEIPMARAVTSS